jgi:hypothetical protein
MSDEESHGRMIQLAEQVNSREDLINFISELEAYVDRPPPDEEVNTSTAVFLGAMAAWTKAQARQKGPDSISPAHDRVYRELSWRTFAWMLLGALRYD